MCCSSTSILHTWLVSYAPLDIQTYMVQTALLLATQNPGVQVGGQAMENKR